MRSRNWKFAPALVTLVLAVASAPAALAQCGMPSKLIKPSAFHPAIEGAVPRASTLNDLGVGQSIVGMWHVLFTAQTMNGSAIPDTVIDNALSVWHNDHTEIMNSVRPSPGRQLLPGRMAADRKIILLPQPFRLVRQPVPQ
jgi:hypothetical protein